MCEPNICIPIFITVFVIGNLVILNLFLALLLNSFSGDVLQQTEASSNSFAVAGQRIKKWTIVFFSQIPGWLRRLRSFCVNRLWKKYFLYKSAKQPRHDFVPEFMPIKAGVCGIDDAFSRSPSLSGAYAKKPANGIKYVSATQQNHTPSQNKHEMQLLPQEETKPPSPAAPIEPLEPPNPGRPPEKYHPEECLPSMTRYIQMVIKPDSKWAKRFWRCRCQCYKIVEHRIYETLLIFTILLSSIALVFEDINLNSSKRSSLKIVLYYADVFFCLFFSVEMIMKVIAYGLRKYFTNWWCCLDFFIVTVSVISIYYSETPHSKVTSNTSSSSLSVLRVLRTMRALRPLRALSRFQGMRVVVDALMKAIPSIGKISTFTISTFTEII